MALSISIGILPYKILSLLDFIALFFQHNCLKKVINKNLYNIKNTKIIFFTPCTNNVSKLHNELYVMNCIYIVYLPSATVDEFAKVQMFRTS